MPFLRRLPTHAQEAGIAAPQLDRLAAELGRPVTALTGFDDLTPEQIDLLTDAVRQTKARRRREIRARLDATIPPPLRPFVYRALRGRWR